MRCAVPNCRNFSDCRSKRNAAQQQRLGFFRFPKCPDTFKAWLAFCGYTEESLKLKNPCICIEHFKDEDIEGSLKFEMGLAKKRTLRPGAVPCVNKSQESGSDRARKERSQRRRNQELVAELLAEEEAKLIHPEATSFEQDSVYLSETVTMELDPLSGEEKLEELQKCRTCYNDFTADSRAKDLFDPANSVLLFHIEVISGVWISHKPDEPRLMCPACKSALDQAIDFREMCISTELKLSQAKPSTDEVQIEAENEDPISSDHDLISDTENTNVEEIEDAGGDHVEDEATSDDQTSQEAVDEVAESPAAQDPLSVALGAKIFKELLDQYTGKEKARLRKGAPIASKPKAKEKAAGEQKPKRSANPKTTKIGRAHV